MKENERNIEQELESASRILALSKNKTRPISFVVNPELWDGFRKAAKNKGSSASGLLEEFMISTLIKENLLTD